MKKISYFLFVFTVALLCACNGKKTEQQPADTEKKVTDPIELYNEIDRTSAPNTITEAEKSKGWELLFDGTTSNGWHGYNQKGIPDCWVVEDGTLTMSSVGAQEEQDLVTDKEYKSFVLSLEYKMTKGANSGVLFQIKEDPKYKFAYETGPEFQVIDHENWHEKLEDWQINGGNYAMYPPVAKPYKALGEWNQLMLIVNGNEVTQILNGTVTVNYVKYSEQWKELRNSGKWSAFPDYGKYDEGHISLQNHGTKVWYRNIMIKECFR